MAKVATGEVVTAVLLAAWITTAVGATWKMPASAMIGVPDRVSVRLRVLNRSELVVKAVTDVAAVTSVLVPLA